MPEAHACEPPSRPATDLPEENNGISVRTSVQEPGILWVVAPVVAVIFACCCLLLCFLLKRYVLKATMRIISSYLYAFHMNELSIILYVRRLKCFRSFNQYR